MKRLLWVLVLSFSLSGCVTYFAAAFAGANAVYTGYQEYEDYKEEKRALRKQEREQLKFERMERQRKINILEERE